MTSFLFKSSCRAAVSRLRRVKSKAPALQLPNVPAAIAAVPETLLAYLLSV
jgi:hypothetical protein